MDPGQVGGQVVGEPAVAGSERLGPGGLGVPHDAEPIAEGLEGGYFVVPDPEPLPAPGEVDVLGREPAPLARALRLASLILRDCRWYSAHLGQRVCSGIAGLGQLLHLPVALAIRRCSWARRRLYSMRSGFLFLACSYSRRATWLVSLAAAISSGVLPGAGFVGCFLAMALAGAFFSRRFGCLRFCLFLVRSIVY